MASPRCIEDTGLGLFLLAELLAKILHRSGPQRLADLADRMALPVSVLEPLLTFLRAERLVQVAGRGGVETEVVYALSDAGRARGEEMLRKSQYVGPAPVSLAAYVERVQRQSVRDLRVGPELIRHAFQGVRIDERLLDLLGVAMNSGRAIFLYGAGGGGKSHIAERLADTLSGDVDVPHAIAVGDEVIAVFDPLVHRPVADTDPRPSLDAALARDRRWVRCRRPAVTTGGELTLRMLDLEFDATARFYQAPPQLKANNGLLVIDDLGRQLVRPQELMNRWIVPLDRRVDFLALHNGRQFLVPFDVTVVFCTNLAPAALADGAFLRRLGYKIHIGALAEGDYCALLQDECRRLGVGYCEEAAQALLRRHARERRPLLACYPRDLLGQLRDHARYRGTDSPRMSEAALAEAWTNYFADAEPASDAPLVH